MANQYAQDISKHSEEAASDHGQSLDLNRSSGVMRGITGRVAALLTGGALLFGVSGCKNETGQSAAELQATFESYRVPDTFINSLEHANSAGAFDGIRNGAILAPGSRSDAVAHVQEILSDFYPEFAIEATGNYDEYTGALVQGFESFLSNKIGMDINPDTNFDQRTLEGLEGFYQHAGIILTAFDSVRNGSRVLERGHMGDPLVARMQGYLRDLGIAEIANDGDFGRNTEAALKRFQQIYYYANPHADPLTQGIFDANCLQALEDVVNNTELIQIGLANHARAVAAPIEGLGISRNALQCIMDFEGYRSEAYLCDGGEWTIGYGHTSGVHEGMTCNESTAMRWLMEDIRDHVTAVEAHLGLETQVTQAQFDALVSFTFNVGGGALEDSTLLKRIHEGNLADVPNQFRRWNKADGEVLEGLVNRREAEIALWNGEGYLQL